MHYWLISLKDKIWISSQWCMLTSPSFLCVFGSIGGYGTYQDVITLASRINDKYGVIEWEIKFSWCFLLKGFKLTSLYYSIRHRETFQPQCSRAITCGNIAWSSNNNWWDTLQFCSYWTQHTVSKISVRNSKIKIIQTHCIISLSLKYSQYAQFHHINQFLCIDCWFSRNLSEQTRHMIDTFKTYPVKSKFS